MENNYSTLVICSSGALGNIILKNTLIISPSLILPVISIDDNSALQIAEPYTIQE